MKVKAIVGEERMTLSEVREYLALVEAERHDQSKEMSYELRKSIEHARETGKVSKESSKNLVEKLHAMEKLKPEIVYRIANIMPKSRDELRAIFAKEKYILSSEELDQILEIVQSTI